MQMLFTPYGHCVQTWKPLWICNGRWLGLGSWPDDIERLYQSRRQWFAWALLPVLVAATFAGFMDKKIDSEAPLAQCIAFVTMCILYWGCSFSAGYALCRMAMRGTNARESRVSFYMFMILGFILLPLIFNIFHETPSVADSAPFIIIGVMFQWYGLGQVSTLFSLLLLIPLCEVAVQLYFLGSTLHFEPSIFVFLQAVAGLVTAILFFIHRRHWHNTSLEIVQGMEFHDIAAHRVRDDVQEFTSLGRSHLQNNNATRESPTPRTCVNAIHATAPIDEGNTSTRSTVEALEDPSAVPIVPTARAVPAPLAGTAAGATDCYGSVTSSALQQNGSSNPSADSAAWTTPNNATLLGQRAVAVSDSSAQPQSVTHSVEDSWDQRDHFVHLSIDRRSSSHDYEQHEFNDALHGNTSSPFDPFQVRTSTSTAFASTTPSTPIAPAAGIVYDSEGTVLSRLSSISIVRRTFDSSFAHCAICASEAVQDVSSDLGSLATTFSRSDASPTLDDSVSVPHPRDTVGFQGAWEILADGVADDWLRTFVITGRLVFCGDGTEGFLIKREADNAILLAGGSLQIRPDGNLARTGMNGRTLLFGRISIASEDDVMSFQGLWSSRGMELLIEGIVWKLDGRRSGLVKFESGRATVSRRIMWIAETGDLCLLSPSGSQRVFRFECSVEELRRLQQRLEAQ